MPGPSAYTLRVDPTVDASSGETAALTEVRGDRTMVRSIDDGAGSWRDLLIA